MSLAVIGASRLPGVRNVVGKAAATSVGRLIAKNSLAKAAALGATTDLISEYSQDDNAMGALAKRFPQLDNALATHDADHPMVKTMKNVVEGIGIGFIADSFGILLGKARDRMGKTNKPSREALEMADKTVESATYCCRGER